MMDFLRRLRLLPLLVIVMVLSFTVRLGDFIGGLQDYGTARAQQEVRDDPPPMPEGPEFTEENKGENSEDSTETAAKNEGENVTTETRGLPDGPSQEWRDASEAAFSYSDVKAELYEDLAKRRKELEQREQKLATREALLEAAERELDQKLRELKAVKSRIENILQQQSDKQEERIDSLVKIYEGMKAKDAARIFNTLDMEVLIRVMDKMSERKSAPILAEMDPERARAVTILLAQKNQAAGIQ